MEQRAKNPIVAYKRDYKSKNGEGNYFQVSIEKDVLRDILSGSGTAKLAVFINDYKQSETTPDIVVKASTSKGGGTSASRPKGKLPF
jgi:hypothetical protein